jgi:acetyl esterase
MEFFFWLLGCATLGFLLGSVSIKRSSLERSTKPNAEMQAVLDELDALGPKPFETLSPDEARQQPGPADAVKELLKKQGKSTEPEAVQSVSAIKIPGPSGSIDARI